MKTLLYVFTILFLLLQFVAAQEETISVNFTFGLTHGIKVRRFRSQDQVLSYFCENLTIVDAVELCSKTGTTLLTIDNVQTQRDVVRHLESIIRSLGSSYSSNHPIAQGLWIGGIDNFEEDVWRWINGTQIPTRTRMSGYQNWYRRAGFNEPDNGSDEEHDCLHVSGLRSSLGAWFDDNCWERKFAICGSNIQGFDPCAYSLCVNGGRCQRISGARYRCICPQGYFGFLCQNIERSCSSAPCLHGGNCRIVSYGFECDCSDGYHGRICQYKNPPTSNLMLSLQSSPDPACCVINPGDRYFPLRSGVTARQCFQSNRHRCYDSVHQSCYDPYTQTLCGSRTLTTESTSPSSAPQGWLPWSAWNDCSATCGRGVWMRVRGCLGSTPGSAICPGIGREEVACMERSCSSCRPWGSWQACPVTCGRDFQLRTRECQGRHAEVRECSTNRCPTWGVWSQYMPCSRTSGGAEQHRSRVCLFGNIGQRGCNRLEDSIQRRNCATNDCEFWSNWMELRCSVTCGNGTRMRSRNCIGGSPSMSGCLGTESEVVACINRPCTQWAPWGGFYPCSLTCGGGQQIRIRTCLGGRPGSDCPGVQFEQDPCNTIGCESWSDWSSFTTCTVTCGGGTQRRSRICVGNGCAGPTEQEERCNSNPCDRWGPWSFARNCTNVCGGGTRIRQRSCIGGSPGSGNCIGNTLSVVTCNSERCPMWSPWIGSACTVTCGTGIVIRQRECLYNDKFDCIGLNMMEEECNTEACPFWIPWLDWSLCTESCGSGTQVRVRRCENGVQGQAGCEGNGIERRSCNTELCASWSACSVTCGVGVERRVRVCQIGQTGSPGCPESGFDSRPCTVSRVCPTWTEWGDFSECSNTCGRGSQFRSRVCQNSNNDNNACPGPATQNQDCNTRACPAWSEWSDYSECDALCNSGCQNRVRFCIGGNPGDEGCRGPSSEARECNTQFCRTWTNWGEFSDFRPCTVPTVSPTWTEWGEFSECSNTCGRGSQFRSRVCQNSNNDNNACPGPATQNQDCNTRACREWSEWSDYNECDALCDTGSQNRVRFCIGGNAGDEGCRGPSSDARACNTQMCRIWTDWGDFADCPVTCNGGVTIRIRTCVVQPGATEIDPNCNGQATDTLSCNTQRCIDWAEWGQYGGCSRSCGRGSRTRRRTCQNGEPGEGTCFGPTIETLTCMTQECPFWVNWSTWGMCSASCNGGIRTRTRTCVNGVRGDVGCLGFDEETENCNENVACFMWSTWGEWAECSSTCGGGIRMRSRDCANASPIDLLFCEGDSINISECNNQTCPSWSDWIPWTDCSASCGRGTRNRLRACLFGMNGQRGCEGDSTAQISCNVGNCPMWSAWGQWAECSVTCGGGMRGRLRDCVNESPSDRLYCEGEPNDNAECNNQTCPSWSDWIPWSECSASCGTGTRNRLRACLFGMNGHRGCEGNSISQMPCTVGNCPMWSAWGQWAECSVTCGGGMRGRLRDCVNESPSDRLYCEGESNDNAECNNQTCPSWSDWIPWSDCSVSCGTGTRKRKRACLFGVNGQRGCEGNSISEMPCTVGPCTFWSTWDSWTMCSATCGRGFRFRLRTCRNGIAGQGSCVGNAIESATCTQMCSQWSEWSLWSPCSEECEGGETMRQRNCINGAVGQGGCIGPTQESNICNTQDCPEWSEWSQWNDCDSICGGGTRFRNRFCIGGNVGDFGCNGLGEESQDCATEPCSSTWSTWSTYGPCSISCGFGVQFRRRSCMISRNTRTACSGSSAEARLCNTQPCPPNV